MISSEVVRLFTSYNSSDTEAIAVSVIRTLTDVVKHSNAATIMGLEEELNSACVVLMECAKESEAISLKAGCDLFRRYVTRTSLEIKEFSDCKELLEKRGMKFASSSLKSRERIAQVGLRFIQDGSVILMHGQSEVLTGMLELAARQGIQFSVVLSEGRSEGNAVRVSKALMRAGIPVTLVLDSAVAFVMDRADLVLIGASAVVENGGIINTVGSYQVALIANALKRPVYAAAESYTFTRLFPLSQHDLPASQDARLRIVAENDSIVEPPDGLKIVSPRADYTPPHLITLLFTDLGIFTPSAVSDELIKMYY